MPATQHEATVLTQCKPFQNQLIDYMGNFSRAEYLLVKELHKEQVFPPELLQSSPLNPAPKAGALM